MAGVLGFYAASKGSAVVPLLTGLSSAQAQSALTSVSLTVGSVTTTTSGATSGNDGTVASQSVAAGTVLNQQDSVSIVVYSYVVAPPNFPPDFPTPTTTWYCRTTYANGTTTGVTSHSTDQSVVICGDRRTECLANNPSVPAPATPPACPTNWYCRYMENTGDTFTYVATSDESYCTNGVAGVACSTSGYPAPSSGIYTCPPAPPNFTPNFPPDFPTPPNFTPPTFTPINYCNGQPEPYPGECFCTGGGWVC